MSCQNPKKVRNCNKAPKITQTNKKKIATVDNVKKAKVLKKVLEGLSTKLFYYGPKQPQKAEPKPLSTWMLMKRNTDKTASWGRRNTNKIQFNEEYNT
jgi:hypothetical protein